MNQQTTHPFVIPSRSFSRRGFLKSAGALAAAGTAGLTTQAAIPTNPQSDWWNGRGRVNLQIEGFLDTAYVLPPFTNEEMAGIGELMTYLTTVQHFTAPAFKMRLIFPLNASKSTLGIRIFVADVPQSGTPSANSPFPFSYSDVQVQDFEMGTFPTNPTGTARGQSFGLVGKVVSNSVRSPYGDLTGGICAVSGGYRITNAAGAATFNLVAVTVAGSHSTTLPTAEGWLRVR
jgi:hypothetical protein